MRLNKNEIESFIKESNILKEKLHVNVLELLIEELYEICNWEDVGYNVTEKYCMVKNGDDISDTIYYEGDGFYLHPKLLQSYMNYICNELRGD